jgi:hypothetical protein
MLNGYRKLFEAIRCGDPWDWEADADDDDDPVASPRDRADGSEEWHSQAPRLPSPTGTIWREPLRPAA